MGKTVRLAIDARTGTDFVAALLPQVDRYAGASRPFFSYARSYGRSASEWERRLGIRQFSG